MNTISIQYYTNQLCQDNPKTLFIFGDNLIKAGRGGQAIIRPEPNSHGVPTKKLPSMTEDSFFNDTELEENKKFILDALDSIPDHYDTIAFPKDGLGTGLAQLPVRAPQTYQFLVEEINKRFDNVYSQFSED